MAAPVCSDRIVVGVKSLTGGGSLAANAVLTLKNDVDQPGPLQYYGTNNQGVLGWYNLDGSDDTGDPSLDPCACPRIPSQPEKDALAGTSGTPSSSNKYVTNSDARLLPQDLTQWPFRQVSTSDNVSATDGIIEVTVPGVTLTLPDAATINDSGYCKSVFIRNNSGGAISIASAGGLVEGSTIQVLADGETARLFSNKTDWLTS